MRRSVLARVMLHLWGEGETLQEAVAAVVASHGARPSPHAPRRLRRPADSGVRSARRFARPLPRGGHHLQRQNRRLRPEPLDGGEAGDAPRHDADSLCRPSGHQGARCRRCSGCELLHVLNARSPAQEPQHRFWVVEVGPPSPSLPSAPRRFYIGRQVGCSERIEPMRALELKNRRYLGAHPCACALHLAILHLALTATLAPCAQARRRWTTKCRSSCATWATRVPARLCSTRSWARAAS